MRDPRASEWTSAAVERWFAANTFHAREFTDLGELVALKRRQGVTISLGLPALNGGLSLDVRELREVERPPIATFPAYRSRRAAQSAASITPGVPGAAPRSPVPARKGIPPDR